MREAASKPAQLPEIPHKRYFAIGEVSDLCAVKPHVLRYWEQEFPQLREFLLPVAQHVWLHRAEVADLADGEVALVRDLRQLRRLTRCFPHRSRPSAAASARGGTSPRAAPRSESLRPSSD